jgi:predicted metal-dependent hydrolase
MSRPDPTGLPAHTLRRSTRARHLRIQVTPREGVVLVLPRGVSTQTAQAFLEERRAWVLRSLDRLGLGPTGPRPPALPEEIALRASGESCRVRYAPGVGPVRARTAGRDGVSVRGPLEDRNAVAAALRDWLRRRARPWLAGELAALSERTGLGYRRLAVRSQRTLWGSYSARGTLSLNAKLLLLEPELARYVMIHELAHSRHMNHSPRFWALVARHEPDYRSKERALRTEGRALPAWVEA